jgi:hypothetical protein
MFHATLMLPWGHQASNASDFPSLLSTAFLPLQSSLQEMRSELLERIKLFALISPLRSCLG